VEAWYVQGNLLYLAAGGLGAAELRFSLVMLIWIIARPVFSTTLIVFS
jgi:hypothetical protein